MNLSIHIQIFIVIVIENTLWLSERALENETVLMRFLF